MYRIRRNILATLLCCLAAASVFADDGPVVPGKVFAPDNPGLTRQLQDELERQRDNNAQLQRTTDPSDVIRLERRLLIERLQAEGYYDGDISVDGLAPKPRYQVETGPRYRIDSVTIAGVDEAAQFEPELSLQAGQPLLAQAVLEALDDLKQQVAEQLCLYQVQVDYQVLLLSDRPVAKVSFTVADSPAVVVGQVSIEGLTSIEDSYLLDRFKVEPGDCFNREALDSARLKLMQSNLLASASAQVSPPKDGRVDISLQAQERHHRTLRAGGGYQSEEGLGLSLGWEHRNYFGRAERLRLELFLAQRRRGIGTELAIPHYKKTDQNLKLYSDLSRQDTDAYLSNNLDMGAELSRKLSKKLRISGAAELSILRVREGNRDDDFALLSTPLGAEWDNRDDPLDSRKGWVLALNTRPYWDLNNPDRQFLKSNLATSFYAHAEHWPGRPTLAGRAAMGSISGGSREEVPATVRFYVGGGGSVRGYAYQSLGPTQSDGRPAGGLSFSEVSLEARVHWKQHWGAVLFVDGGWAYRDHKPSLDEPLLWGAGVGLRYFTDFAPLRLDIAVPLDRRPGVDDSFQFYLSIGQAF